MIGRISLFVGRSAFPAASTNVASRGFGSFDKLVDPCSSWTFSELEKPLKPVRAKEEVAAVPDMSIVGLSMDSVTQAVKNLVSPAATEGKPKLGRWAVGCDSALQKKYT